MRSVFILLFIFAVARSETTKAASDSIVADSGLPSIELPEERLQVDGSLVDPVKKNPWVSAGLSALIPGGGQLYSGHPFRGIAFLAAEASAGAMVADRIVNTRARREWYQQKRSLAEFEWEMLQKIESIEDSSARNMLIASWQRTELEKRSAEYDWHSTRNEMRHAIGWTVGAHAWNIADAVARSNYFLTYTPRKPTLAGWLSAIPGLGLGQIYNGSYSKAAMIWAVQSMLAYQAYNYHQLMEEAARRRRPFLNKNNWEHQYTSDRLFSDWHGRYRDSFRQRNIFLWYSVFFYFYGIFDAIVDAHMHDYPVKIRFQPESASAGAGVGLSLDAEF